VSTQQDWIERVGAIRKWTRGGERAPHKPLLLLFALGRLQRIGRNEPIRYVDAELPLASLLADFGPPRQTSPAYPFRRLANDGLWVLSTPSGQSVEDQPAALRRADARGVLETQFAEALLGDSALLSRVARFLLDSEFPDSLHAAICTQVGLELDWAELGVAVPTEGRRRRNASFRSDVLVAYEYRCAMCGYEGRVGAEAVGLEAAHVRWWAFDGPDDVTNGLTLCTMHHLLFDRGVIGVSQERTMAVSRHFVGHDESSAQFVLALSGRDLALPQTGIAPVEESHFSWHRAEVFRGPPRG